MFILKFRRSAFSPVWFVRSRSSSFGTEPEAQRTKTRVERTCSCRGRRGLRWGVLQRRTFSLFYDWLSLTHPTPLQPYSSSEPPLVRVTRGPVFSAITSCYKHFTHTVQLFHLDGKHQIFFFVCLIKMLKFELCALRNACQVLPAERTKSLNVTDLILFWLKFTFSCFHLFSVHI